TRWPRDWSSDVCSSALLFRLLAGHHLLGNRRGTVDEPLELPIDDAGFVLRRVHRRRRPARQLELGGIMLRAPVVVVARVGMRSDARYLAWQLVATRLCFSRDHADIRTAENDRLVVQVAG